VLSRQIQEALWQKRQESCWKEDKANCAWRMAKKVTTQVVSTLEINLCSKVAENSKSEIRNSKWFDRLTILSTVEGQIRIPNDKNSKLRNPLFLFQVINSALILEHLKIRISILSRISCFEIPVYPGWVHGSVEL